MGNLSVWSTPPLRINPLFIVRFSPLASLDFSSQGFTLGGGVDHTLGWGTVISAPVLAGCLFRLLTAQEGVLGLLTPNRSLARNFVPEIEPVSPLTLPLGKCSHLKFWVVFMQVFFKKLFNSDNRIIFWKYLKYFSKKITYFSYFIINFWIL